MIIRYDFLDGTFSEVEVDENTARMLAKMDKRDNNIDRKETRRHDQLSVVDPDGTRLASKEDILEDMLEGELRERLMTAISQLKPQQRELLRRVYINGETQDEISESEGVSQQAISSRLKTIYDFLKKILK